MVQTIQEGGRRRYGTGTAPELLDDGGLKVMALLEETSDQDGGRASADPTAVFPFIEGTYIPGAGLRPRQTVILEFLTGFLY
jgi:hypothetical protein